VLTTDTKNIAHSADAAVNILNLFYNLVTLTISIICFFLLFVSFTSNVKENAWEFGVLRALGLTSFQVIRVYIYEALCLVVSSIIIGFVFFFFF